MVLENHWNLSWKRVTASYQRKRIENGPYKERSWGEDLCVVCHSENQILRTPFFNLFIIHGKWHRTRLEIAQNVYYFDVPCQKLFNCSCALPRQLNQHCGQTSILVAKTSCCLQNYPYKQKPSCFWKYLWSLEAGTNQKVFFENFFGRGKYYCPFYSRRQNSLKGPHLLYP